MHLLATRAGDIADGSGALDLGQTPADILFLSAADSELAALALGFDQWTAGKGTPPRSLRLANLMALQHHYSVDLYVERMVGAARLVVVRLLGGERYWPYGVEQISAAAREAGVPVAFLPGDDRPDPDLVRLSTVPPEPLSRLWQYLVQAGPGNTLEFLRYAACLTGLDEPWREPAPLPRALLYWPGLAQPSLAEIKTHWRPDRPVAAIIFYRALLQSVQLAPVDALIAALTENHLNALPIAVSSLREAEPAAIVERLFDRAEPDVILNLTSFSVRRIDGSGTTPFPGTDCPVLQVIVSATQEATWRAGTVGLPARDVAMNVALPEVDGALITRAISFKNAERFHEPTQCTIVAPQPVADRVRFASTLAAAWTRLRTTPVRARRVAIVLANYPNRDGRLANGVGLDTPASVAAALAVMADEGYAVRNKPADGAALIADLQAGPTNDLRQIDDRTIFVSLPVSTYEAWFAELAPAVRSTVLMRWGLPDDDPHVANGLFRLPIRLYGSVAVGIQPARGYHVDPVETYHAPDLPPPHAYFAFYAWLRLAPADGGFGAHAVVHFGKHGNLEWLPGKAVALSEECFPEAVFGPLPHLYPFIVNDPGEGTQAKRRAQAVILDHLTPPLTRAGSYGPLRELEALVDEYFEASSLDPRRLPILRTDILDLAARLGLDKDCGFDAKDEDTALARLDGYLCELKELQIRDGLHVFGSAPTGRQLTDLLVALVRLPRGRGVDGDASLLRALAEDLGYTFDPLDLENRMGIQGPQAPGKLLSSLEDLATDLVSGVRQPDPTWGRTRLVLNTISTTVRPALEACGDTERQGLLRGLDGRFIPPGPSGAPTRGRPEVLPTGRNFFSVDPRAVPTPAAWTLGWKSASLLLERYAQEHGDWPKAIALTAWGTANMRTGGDDLCQALALMGVRPRWDGNSSRVAGFEVMPAEVLGRPRVDVTLRVSGFFRDAFPFQMDLVDSAVRAVADLDEPEEVNPLAARARQEAAALTARGVPTDVAQRRSTYRVFGSKPGAYGAGLQALIDEGLWRQESDFADAFLQWGGYAYGGGVQGAHDRTALEKRLSQVDAVVQNQDNREHDLLDSDDYYQFEGGLASAVKMLSGRAPTIYHNDHSRPETPKIRRLEEEIGRVVRGRCANPKWIAGVMRHGYKGAFEIAATVDYLFAFAATTGAVHDHHFDAVYEAYIDDEQVRAFMAEANPAALAETAARLKEALDRGLWRPRSNRAWDQLTDLSGNRPDM